MWCGPWLHSAVANAASLIVSAISQTTKVTLVADALHIIGPSTNPVHGSPKTTNNAVSYGVHYHPSTQPKLSHLSLPMAVNSDIGQGPCSTFELKAAVWRLGGTCSHRSSEGLGRMGLWACRLLCGSTTEFRGPVEPITCFTFPDLLDIGTKVIW